MTHLPLTVLVSEIINEGYDIVAEHTTILTIVTHTKRYCCAVVHIFPSHKYAVWKKKLYLPLKIPRDVLVKESVSALI